MSLAFVVPAMLRQLLCPQHELNEAECKQIHFPLRPSDSVQRNGNDKYHNGSWLLIDRNRR